MIPAGTDTFSPFVNTSGVGGIVIPWVRGSSGWNAPRWPYCRPQAVNASTPEPRTDVWAEGNGGAFGNAVRSGRRAIYDTGPHQQVLHISVPLVIGHR